MHIDLQNVNTEELPGSYPEQDQHPAWMWPAVRKHVLLCWSCPVCPGRHENEARILQLDVFLAEGRWALWRYTLARNEADVAYSIELTAEHGTTLPCSHVILSQSCLVVPIRTAPQLGRRRY